MSDLPNRTAVMVRQTPAYAEWVESLEPKTREVLQTSVDEKTTLYLIKPLKLGVPIEARMLMERNWERIAGFECAVCSLAELPLPPMKSLEDFEKFFSWEYSSCVVDLEALPSADSSR